MRLALMRVGSLLRLPVVVTLLSLAAGAWAGSSGGRGGGGRAMPRDDEERHLGPPPAPAPAARPSFRAAPKARMGATPGGAQDIGYARQQAEQGAIPHAATFTPEGLLSEYDLPLPPTRKCAQILCLEAAAAPASLLAQPEVRTLAQLGFGSNLDPATWRRPPLNLVAVVDKSGSMSGQPLETVKASLSQLLAQLGPKDQLSIVLYGDRSHVHLTPTSAARQSTIRASIAAIQSAGSTAMEEGLKVGFALAQKSAAGFAGTSRVMLFTDERPNVGRTDADSFMGMARAASGKGIGMTTVGVSTHFGAELATQISSVRGGNLFFFPDPSEMKARFVRDFDTMVTELAYDMSIVVEPRKGFELVGLYGLPGDLVERTETGGLRMTLETVFLSRDAGGIFFGFKPATGGLPASGPVADIALSYVDTQQQRHGDRLAVTQRSAVPLGLARGALLVDQVTTLRQASILHRERNETEKAFRLVRALHQRFQQSRDPALAKERKLVATIDGTLTRLSGHEGEGAPPSPPRITRNAVTGLPSR